jgi:hypothetical protein
MGAGGDGAQDGQALGGDLEAVGAQKRGVVGGLGSLYVV